MYPNFDCQIIHIMVPEFKPRFYEAEHFENLVKGQIKPKSRLASHRFSQKPNG
jgi:hypothetical protein